MADPVLTLSRAFAEAITAAFGAEHAATDPAIRRSTHADYQANAAMALAKCVGKPPRVVAAAILEHLRLEDVCAKVEIAGPGFFNLTLKNEFLERELTATAASASFGLVPSAAPETVVIDYSAPNLAKEMHVGHLRSTILGDVLARVLEAQGHQVIRQNHVGDWGTPFGMLIEHLIDRRETEGEFSIGDLNTFYQEARGKFEKDPAFAFRARKRVVLLQGGDEATLGLWRRFVDASKRYFDAAYRRLGVTLTEADIAGESRYNPVLPELVAELEARGLARLSEGAMCVFPPGFTGREGEPLPLILRKQDGGYGYGTTDVAAVRYRVQTLHATRLVYVVGAPQSQHLAMVYATAKLAGWLVPPARALHVAFGSILGPDKKMFKTRSGESVKLLDLIEEAIERAAKVVTEKTDLDPAACADVARAVGVGAIKYADLCNDRIKDYVFDWDRMLAFEGNTAPYLMYARARILSIFSRIARDGIAAAPGAFVVRDPAERALALELLRFGSVVAEVERTLEPHRLCGYLFELASAYTSFYERCPVLKAATDEERASRLAFCDLTAKVLARGLDLLGIEAPERM